jgi:hypothetical protein
MDVWDKKRRSGVRGHCRALSVYLLCRRRRIEAGQDNGQIPRGAYEYYTTESLSLRL